jgi:hypothetical protein
LCGGGGDSGGGDVGAADPDAAEARRGDACSTTYHYSGLEMHAHLPIFDQV